MKSISTLIVVLISCFTAYSQDTNNINDNIPAAELEKIMAKSIQYYGSINRISQKQTTAMQGSHVLFGWPLRTTAEYDDIPSYYMIQNYVDDNNDNLKIDYNCGNRTYDGHNGTDINIWPFWWDMMNKNYVQVVAAAPGIITSVVDNNGNDHNCACMGNNNVISILHSDSTTSIYYHIKDNSALVKEGDVVIQGQPIASVGSSGCSSNPHLHFEVRLLISNYAVLIDPWVRPDPATDCNDRNEDTYWQNQKPYWEPQVNRVLTHSANPVLTGYNNNSNFCANGEFVNAKANFIAGDQVFVGIAMHDYVSATTVSYTIYNPNGTIFTNGTHTNNQTQNFNTWYLVFTHSLPLNAPSGTYKIMVSYFGIDYVSYFSVNCIANYTLTGNVNDKRGFIASNSIISDAVLNTLSQVKMQAAGYIQFNPGFTATAGSTLKARIKDCNYSE